MEKLCRIVNFWGPLPNKVWPWPGQLLCQVSCWSHIPFGYSLQRWLTN